MAVYVNNSTLTFNGPGTVADQFSNPVDLAPGYTNRDAAWYFRVVCTAAGVFGVTLQFNPDPQGESTFGWVDEARTSLTILNVDTCANLAQTNAAISSSLLRGGIISAIGTFNLLFRFNPAPFNYRLRFQLNNVFQGTIPKISFSRGV